MRKERKKFRFTPQKLRKSFANRNPIENFNSIESFFSIYENLNISFMLYRGQILQENNFIWED